MKFQPKSEEQIQEEGLFPAGEYGFEVIEATEKTSKSGNEMIELVLAVYSDKGTQRLVRDYLVNTDKGQFKIRHAADSVGLLDQYETGTLTDAAFKGKTGKLKLKIKPADGDYGPQNQVQDYVKAGAVSASLTSVKSAPVNEDDIPF